MKRYIHASEAPTQIKSNADIVDFLRSELIDTGKCQYELSYTFFDRLGETSNKRVRFTCPSNQLALFSIPMIQIETSKVIPTFDNIDRYFGIEKFVEIIKKNPDFDDLYNYGEDHGWFSKDEFGKIKLINLTYKYALYEEESVDSGEGDYYEGDWDDLAAKEDEIVPVDEDYEEDWKD